MIQNLWSKFKALPWWQKILLGIPFVAVFAIVVFYNFLSGAKINEKVLEHLNEKAIEDIKDFNKTEKVEDVNRKKLIAQQESYKKDIDKIERAIKEKDKKENEKIFDINNADPNQLKSIFADLRERGRK